MLITSKVVLFESGKVEPRVIKEEEGEGEGGGVVGGEEERSDSEKVDKL